jgi:hypothetical protein
MVGGAHPTKKTMRFVNVYPADWAGDAQIDGNFGE